MAINVDLDNSGSQITSWAGWVIILPPLTIRGAPWTSLKCSQNQILTSRKSLYHCWDTQTFACLYLGVVGITERQQDMLLTSKILHLQNV